MLTSYTHAGKVLKAIIYALIDENPSEFSRLHTIFKMPLAYSSNITFMIQGQVWVLFYVGLPVLLLNNDELEHMHHRHWEFINDNHCFDSEFSTLITFKSKSKLLPGLTLLLFMLFRPWAVPVF